MQLEIKYHEYFEHPVCVCVCVCVCVLQVAICAGCNVMPTWGSAVTGVIAGFVFLFIHVLLPRLKGKEKMSLYLSLSLYLSIYLSLSLTFFNSSFPPSVDDPLDAVAVHLGGGLWGLVAVAVFQQDGGLVFGGGLSTLIWNMLGALAILAWVGGVCGVMFGGLRYLGWLRIGMEMEIQG